MPQRRGWVEGLRDNWAVGVLGALVVGMVGTLYAMNNDRIAAIEKHQEIANANIANIIQEMAAERGADTEWRKAVMVRFDDLGKRIDGVQTDVRELRTGR